jgi:ribosome biogenesis GTPase A
MIPEGFASEQPKGYENHIKKVAIVGVSNVGSPSDDLSSGLRG